MQHPSQIGRLQADDPVLILMSLTSRAATNGRFPLPAPERGKVSNLGQGGTTPQILFRQHMDLIADSSAYLLITAGVDSHQEQTPSLPLYTQAHLFEMHMCIISLRTDGGESKKRG